MVAIQANTESLKNDLVHRANELKSDLPIVIELDESELMQVAGGICCTGGHIRN